jgi:hypothetical protein
MAKKKYTNKKEIRYYSRRYNKWVIVPVGYPSDGATGAIDIDSESWWVHDKLCDTGTWEDGTCVSNWQASYVLSDILWNEGRWARAKYWFLFTWLRGGGKCRENGMFKCADK